MSNSTFRSWLLYPSALIKYFCVVFCCVSAGEIYSDSERCNALRNGISVRRGNGSLIIRMYLRHRINSLLIVHQAEI
ncbi:hypothetical protein P280DRAFT_162489 [Massarina eburnea CBS 473.64]|uniref:Uncharacterized protein n=1 Tax=Massarina eburnea CBS 473.64 TaxID=1395130 RepID=A0A6A6RLA5_9PLEO|nr:hypothetical protein P280DRAFT_162489 [Massarina eburnea CBS 473.64]